jgi:glyoxylate reductase
MGDDGRVARCFVTRELPGDALQRLRAGHEVTVWPEPLPPGREELASAAAEVEGLLCLLTDRIDAALLDRCPRLRAISNLAVGTDNIDLAECARRGIPVGHTPGVLTEATADLAFALLLAGARRVVEASGAVVTGEWRTWDPSGWLGYDVHGATLGIVGPGKIGSAVARRAVGFGMEVLLSGGSAGPGRIELGELVERSDFVSLHVPLSDETRGMIGEAELRAMRPTAILVNTARGEIVDQDALRRALEEGWIGGAALDVTVPEPLPPDDPLLTAPNLTVLPHIGSASHAAREAMADLAVENLLRALRGEEMPHRAA